MNRPFDQTAFLTAIAQFNVDGQDVLNKAEEPQSILAALQLMEQQYHHGKTVELPQDETVLSSIETLLPALDQLSEQVVADTRCFPWARSVYASLVLNNNLFINHPKKSAIVEKALSHLRRIATDPDCQQIPLIIRSMTWMSQSIHSDESAYQAPEPWRTKAETLDLTTRPSHIANWLLCQERALHLTEKMTLGSAESKTASKTIKEIYEKIITTCQTHQWLTIAEYYTREANKLDLKLKLPTVVPTSAQQPLPPSTPIDLGTAVQSDCGTCCIL